MVIDELGDGVGAEVGWRAQGTLGNGLYLGDVESGMDVHGGKKLQSDSGGVYQFDNEKWFDETMGKLFRCVLKGYVLSGKRKSGEPFSRSSGGGGWESTILFCTAVRSRAILSDIRFSNSGKCDAGQKEQIHQSLDWGTEVVHNPGRPRKVTGQ